LPRLVRFVLRGVGGERKRASGLLSYLLFQPEYTDMLMELGYSDAVAQWDAIDRFLAPAAARSPG
jgi:NTE family protein